MSPRSLAKVCALVVLCRLVGATLAATPEENARAKEHFRKGRVHYELSEYKESLREFKDAYRVIQDPVLLFNIAQCHWKLGQPREALDFYRNYLRRAPTAANRAEVEKRIEELQKETESAERAPTPAPVVATPPPPADRAPAAEPMPMPRTEAPGPQAVDLTAPAAAANEAAAFYTRWWFWTGVGAVVAGAVVIGLVAGGREEMGKCPGAMPCISVGR